MKKTAVQSGNYIGERVFWDMELGRHKITCVDGLGRSSSIMVVVR